MKRAVEVLISFVLISVAVLAFVVINDAKLEAERIRQERWVRMEARLDSLKVQYTRDSIAVEGFRARWDSLAATTDTILQLRK